MADYLYQHNANTHWNYPTSSETDAMPLLLDAGFVAGPRGAEREPERDCRSEYRSRRRDRALDSLVSPLTIPGEWA